jgi:hypothetical protein
MADQLQLRGGSTAQTAAFTGALREVTVDTDKKTVVVHDGTTAGGNPLLRQDLSNLPAGTIDNADINASAGIVDTKLATIATAGKVSNSATTATSANTYSAIVARDASGNFTAGTITGALTGAASSNVLKAGDTMTGALGIIAGSAAAPGLFFSGDNTGIYSPGADQVAIATGGTQQVTVDANGRLGIGTSSPGYALDAAAADATDGLGIRIRANATAGKAGLQFTNSDASSELARIAADSNGLRIISSIFLFDATAPYPTAATGQIASKTNSPTAYSHLVLGNGGQAYFYVNVADSYGWNVAPHVLGLGAIASNNRSINAAGTINASGADYAEYMSKAGDFNLAKGAVCGVNANGEVTNTFVDSVSFVVKSTNPSYVGGDTWGTEEIVGAKPDMNDVEEFAAWEAKLEAKRQKVDRIAFAGQVPVNVTGATPGQYIVPVATADGGITGIAKDEADLTLPEYMRAVGKVIAIEDDGRARIIVKVA